MDSKNLRGLMEAYSEVYAPQENIEEGLRSAVKRLLGGGEKEAEAPKPESRGEQLRKKYNVGPEKSDTSAKRQILNRSRARAERDERDYGGSKYSKSVAQQSKAAHDRYLKAGYSKYGAGDARGKGNKAARRAATLNREEFDWLVNSLLDEGYDLSTYTIEEFYDFCCEEWRESIAESDYNYQRALQSKKQGKKTMRKAIGGKIDAATKRIKDMKKSGEWYKEEADFYDIILSYLLDEGYVETLEEAEWMMANVIDEEAVAIILGEEQLDELSNRTVSNALNARIAATGAASDRAYKHRNPQAMRAAETAADKEARMKGAVARRRARMNKEDFEAWLDEAMTNYEKNRKRAAQRAAARNAARDQGKTGAVPGVGYVTPRRERETWTDESGKTRHAKGL
jgi:hypothetical protein